MRRNALNLIEEYEMLPRGSRVIVGFSGGADSVALLSFLYELQEQFQLELVACHINHQLRGEESDRDEAFCRTFCEERKVPLCIFREDIAEGSKQAGKSVEEYARQVRYERFEFLCHSAEDRIATAHNANDLAETLLFHIARGTGSKGLIGIPAVRGNIIRPLLHCSREQIEAYCAENGLSYVTDSSNLGDAYSRNRLRHHVMPQMERINPAFVKSAIRLSKQAAREEDYWKKQLTIELERIALTEDSWNIDGFAALHPALQKRAAAYWLECSQADVSEKKINDVLKIIQQGGTLELCKGMYLESGNVIRLKSAPRLQNFFSVPLQVGSYPLFDGKKVEITLQKAEKFEFFANIEEEGLKNVFDYDKICGKAVIRQKLPGDAIQLNGWGHPRSFKKMLNQRKITVEERSRLAVICDEVGPLWLEGFGVRADALPDKQSINIATICVLEE